MPPYLEGDALLTRFQALDAFLNAHTGLWKPRPFTTLKPTWAAQHPELAQWLAGRTLADAEHGERDPSSVSAPAPYPQLAAEALALTQIGPLPSTELPPASSRAAAGVPGRKWQQIEAFAACLPTAPPVGASAAREAPPSTHYLDWCAGKGHLGRRLLQPHHHLTSLEYDPALVTAAQALSDRQGLTARHLLQDVMTPDTHRHLTPDSYPIALHACGDLHVQLLKLATQQQCAHLALSPCCYNRITGDRYTPLSIPAQASTLTLDLLDLALPLTEAVTASTRVRRQRDHSMARRLAFDLLQREQRGEDTYLSTPSLPTAWLDKPFETYCRDLAELRGVPVTGSPDWAALEAAGWQRLAEVRNQELVRNLFRRPLELWLVLDRALYLLEHGYSVKLGTFCDYPLTPRNLMLLAQRR